MRSDHFLDDVLDLLSNVLFPVVVFLIWAALTVVGTIVDQRQPLERYYMEYPEAVANLIVRLHLTDVFHSLPYIALVVLLLASMSVCTFRRVIPKRFPKDKPVPIDHFGLHAGAATTVDAEAGARRMTELLRRRGFLARTLEAGGERWVFGDKQLWARYGVLVAHLGFATIVCGVFVGWARGFDGQLQIYQGDTVPVAHASARVHVTKFAAAFEPVRTPQGSTFYQASSFRTEASIDGPSGARAAAIAVNHPYVSPEGVYYYQASYGYGGRLRVTRHGADVALPGDGRLAPQDTVLLPGTSRAIEYMAMVGPSDPSQLPPGMRLPPVDEYVLWIVHDNLPVGDRPAFLPVGRSVDVGDGYRITALAPLPWTGLTYRYDPGGVWVAAGCVVLVAGFAMSLFFVPVKVYARVRQTAAGSVVDIAATTTKGNAIYEDDFRQLIDDARRTLAESPGTEAKHAYA